jgi:predicted lipoprotein with Yx(FWY)xxD motif
MSHLVRIAAGLLVIGLALPAFAADPAKTATTSKGPALTDAKGMTLYTFDKDEGGKSVCNGPCAVNWPPFAAAADAKPEGKYTVVSRDDGSKQWAYAGKPLYAWKNDTKAGDVTGDGVNSVWHIAKP